MFSITRLCAIVACVLMGALVPAQIVDTRVSPSEFAIFPWDGGVRTPAQLQEAYECGFNLSGFSPAEVLDDVKAAGLQAFVHDPLIQLRGGEKLDEQEIQRRVSEITTKTKDHPATFGYHLIDEPHRDLFPLLAKWINAFHAADPDAIAYVNLFPDYGAKPGPGGPFEDYLSSFVRTTGAKVYSYDHYALFQDGRLRDAYFPNLEAARKVTNDTGVPFWHVVLGNTHFDYAEPSAAGFNFQVYTSLAYGARGIGWFTYMSRERGNYRLSAIDPYGRRTPTWDLMRDANLQIHRLAPHLVKMKHVGVFHHPAVPSDCRGIDTSQHLSNVRGRGPFVVGEFIDDRDTSAVLIVNKSLTQSTNFWPDAKTPATVRKISSTTGENIPWSAENDWLAPGQGMLLLLEAKE